MKKLILVLVLSISGLSAFAQQADKRLYDSYSESEIATMMLEDKDGYNLLLFALDNATYTSSFPKEKEEMKSIKTISLPKDGKYTFASLGLRIEDETQYYRIAGTELMLVVKARQILKYEQQQKLK